MSNMKSRRQFLTGAAATGASIFALAAPKRSWAAMEKPYRRSLSAIGTRVNIDVFGAAPAQAREAVTAAFEEIKRIDRMMTTHSELSLLSRMNRLAGNDSVEADQRLIDVLRASVRWSELTAGQFDVTTLPLLKAWGFRPDALDIPESVEAARKAVNYRAIKIEGSRAGLTKSGAGADFGGIAKGYAVDRAAETLRKWGIEKAIIDGGGDLYCIGHPEDAAGWKIGLQHPRADGNCAIFEAPADAAIATSDDYAERAARDGRSYCDKFNPASGEPIERFMSVTTRAKTCMDADAASVALFIAGRSVDAALAAEGIATLCVTGDGSGLKFDATPGFPAFKAV